MRYLTTRGEAPPVSFLEAVERGLAPDGGLYLPAHLPEIGSRLRGWAELSYPQLAAEFFGLFSDDLPREEWKRLCSRAYAGWSHEATAPVLQLAPRLGVLELFHGPTLAFKDFALQLLGLLYKRAAERSGRLLNIVGATSGDTGAAAIQGCLGHELLRIFILYPAGRIAPLQERQMTCTGADSVYAIPIEGTFDDAQRVVKQVLGDTTFARRHGLVAVNSINIARILAQSVYYIWAWLRLPPDWRDEPEFVVPTGNFGNVFAGWLVQQMGLPIGRFRVATNRNDILHRFFQTGAYEVGPVEPSLAPSMDIQLASNFERLLFYAAHGDPVRVRAAMAALATNGRLQLIEDGAGHRRGTASRTAAFTSSRLGDDEIPTALRTVHDRFGYVACPHTACAFTPEVLAEAAAGPHRVVLATASPAKFPETVRAALGLTPTHPFLEALAGRTPERHPLPATAEALKGFITS